MSATDTIEDFINTMESMGYSSTDHTYLIPFPKTKYWSTFSTDIFIGYDFISSKYSIYNKDIVIFG